MESKMKCKVVMLTTNRAIENGICLTANNDLFITKRKEHGNKLFDVIDFGKENHSLIPQHLYLVSNEELVLSSDNTGAFIRTHTMTGNSDIVINPYFGFKYKYQRIIATTDSSLNHPLIPQSFIEKYVEVNGKIEEVMIELELIEADEFWFKQFPDSIHDKHYKVKTRKDNTVIISKVKDTWTKEEVEILCAKAALAAIVNFKKPDSFDIDDWLIKNLN